MIARFIGGATIAVAATFFGASGFQAAAQTFPTRPIMVVVPYGPGSILGINMRLIANKVEEIGGIKIVIETRPGAGGTLGSNYVKQSKADGYTLLHADYATHGANVSLKSNLPYDPVKDFDPITLLYLSQTVLFVPTIHKVNSVAELREAAKTKPGGLSYGSPGMGSAGHLMGAMLAKAFGVPMTHVPYTSSSQTRTDLNAGRIDLLFNNYAGYRSDAEAGFLKVIGIAATSRMELLPDVPTMAETGFPGVAMDTWLGLVAPAGVPQPVLQKLNALFTQALRSPDLNQKLVQAGFGPKPTTAAEFGEIIKQDIARMAMIVRETGAAAR